MKKTYAIAIDGPAGAGKSTLARQLAAALGFRYVDTGAIYRTVAYHMALMGIGPKDTDGVTRLLDDVNLEIRYDEAGVQHMILNGADVTDEIRTPEMSQAASLISAQKVVREFLLDVQRALARKNNVIMDGRDIGSVVLPQADVKIFFDGGRRRPGPAALAGAAGKGRQADPESGAKGAGAAGPAGFHPRHRAAEAGEGRGRAGHQ